jgi:hypothetical protein
MLHSFSLHPAKSAGWITIKQAHNIQVPSHRSISVRIATTNPNLTWEVVGIYRPPNEDM